MPSIVVGYDGSPQARRALERAAELANGNPVTVVAAVPLISTSPQGPVVNLEPDRLARARHSAKQVRTSQSGTPSRSSSKASATPPT